MKDKYMEYKYAPRSGYSSVHGTNRKPRCEKAFEQKELHPTEISEVVAMVVEYLKSIGIADENYKPIIGTLDKINYNKIKREYSLDSKKDLVWIKCTEDGFVGVVAVSNDVNLEIPQSASEYDERYKNGKWVHKTAGILVHMVGKSWDSNNILVFPLPHMKEKEFSSHDVETGVGNYLIDNGVAIIDYYSHRY